MRFWTRLAAALAAFCLGASVSAQTMTVSGGPVLSVGSSVTISYQNGTPGATITVDMDDGDPDGPKDSKQITLDAFGNGSTSWTVPNWWAVNFNAPGVQEIARATDRSAPPGG